MSSELMALSPERVAQLVPPPARDALLSVLREATALLPVAEAVVAACDAPGIKATEPARTAGRVSSAFHLMSTRVLRLSIQPSLRTHLAQLLEYHSELVGQASLAAYGHRSERTERARGGGGLGTPAIELAQLATWLTRALSSTSYTGRGTEDD